jgi:serine/threonine protein kinase
MSMIGKTLAHYEITSQLGKGGMGEVYQAKDQKLGRWISEITSLTGTVFPRRDLLHAIPSASDMGA